MHASPPRTAVVDLASYRNREENLIESLTLVLNGVNYGTIRVRVPYAPGKPIRLFLTPSAGGDELTGRLDALVTDDEDVLGDTRAAR